MRTILFTALLPGLLSGQPATILSRKAPADVKLSADPSSPFWSPVKGIVTKSDYSGAPVVNHRMEVRSRWTQDHLYLLFVCQYEKLNLKPDPSTAGETPRLWNWDVAEAFIGADFSDITRYREFQVSPQGEYVDLDIDRSGKNRSAGASWNSGFQVMARIDAASKTWYGEMKIPFAAFASGPPAVGRELRAGFFRIAGPEPKTHVSWQATGGKTFHVPEKFGILRLVE